MLLCKQQPLTTEAIKYNRETGNTSSLSQKKINLIKIALNDNLKTKGKQGNFLYLRSLKVAMYDF